MTEPNLLDLIAEIAEIAETRETQEQASELGQLTIAERFEQYHRDNPAVYRVLVAFAREWRRSGRAKLGINSLVERVRWEVAVRTNAPDFKINNSFAPFFSRLIMANEPDLADVFDVRRSAADEWLAGRAA